MAPLVLIRRRVLLSAECELCGYKCQARRYLLCRSLPGGGQRASQTGKARLPTHIDLPVTQSRGLSRDSVVLLEQVRTLDKKRLREKMGHVEESVMEKVDLAIAVSFGLPHDQLV